MNHRPRIITPEQTAMLVELLSSANSLREIALVLGLSTATIRREAAPFLAIMELQGTHPMCSCGRKKFHMHGCSASNRRASDTYRAAGRIGGVRLCDTAAALERRAMIVGLLADGARYVDVGAAIGIHQKTVKKYLRYMTPEQIAQREAAMLGGRKAA